MVGANASMVTAIVHATPARRTTWLNGYIALGLRPQVGAVAIGFN
ncbi:hypothetical protein [Agrobacterium sp. AGB01]|nr:hypothetical protein [Agrobacterium sp. AGB01]